MNMSTYVYPWANLQRGPLLLEHEAMHHQLPRPLRPLHGLDAHAARLQRLEARHAALQPRLLAALHLQLVLHQLQRELHLARHLRRGARTG